MALEDLTGASKFIDDLINTNPADGDSRTDGNNHIFGVKNVLLNTFPNIDAAVTSTPTELNLLTGVSSLGSPLGILTGNGSGNTTIDLDLYDKVVIPAVTAAIDFTFTNIAAGKRIDIIWTSAVSKTFTINAVGNAVFPFATGSSSVTAIQAMFSTPTSLWLIAYSVNGVTV